MSEPIDKSWMSEPDRGNTVYSFGVEAFLKFAEWKLGGEKCRCPCKNCRNRIWFTYKEVGYHLISAGIVKHYRVWNLHGETPSNVAVHPPFVANNIREKASSDVGIGRENPEEEIIGDVNTLLETIQSTHLIGRQEQFEFIVDGHVARPIVEALYPQKLRSVRGKYRTEYLAKASNIEEAKANVPPAVSADLWVQFVDHEFMPEVKERNAKYKINRSVNKVGVAVGRQTYSQIHYKKEKENPTKKRCRVDDWLTGHEHKDGTPLESAKETYEKVKEIHNKMLESGVPTDDISSDALSQVLGEEKKNRVRGVSSCTSKKQLYSSSLALASVNPSQSLGAEMAGLKADMEEVKTLLKAMTRCTPSQCTPGSGVGSTSGKKPMESPRETVNAFGSSSELRKVTLLSRDKREVAKGFVDDSVNMCHGREVCPGEKRVYIEEIMDPDAAVYDGPQDGNMTLNGWLGGGYIIWLAGRLKYDL